MYLQLIKTSIMYDVNLEHFGWNRGKEENSVEYIKRVWRDDYLQAIDNNAFSDMNFKKSMEMNDTCKPQEGTYYFSYTTGIKEKVGNDRQQPELNAEIKKFTSDVIGFDPRESERLKWQDIPKKEAKGSIYGKLLTVIKEASDPIFTNFRYWVNKYSFKLPEIFEKQKFNRNWDALKWNMKRWAEDNDTLVSRVSQEFPRISNEYTSLS